MSEQLLTKCPHCSTTFRLGQEQLDIAGGAVRCGACYQVFHASEYIVKTAAVEEVHAPPPEESPDPFQEFETSEAPQADTENDPYSLDNWDLDSHPDADLFADNYHEKNAASEPSDSEALDALGYAEEPSKKDDTNNDEAWAEKLLEEIGEDTDALDDGDSPDLIQDNPAEDNEHHSNTGFNTISSSESAFSETLDSATDEGDTNDLSPSFNQLDNWNEEDPFAIQEENTPLPTGAVDESWAQAMLNELEQDTTAEPNLDHLEIVEDTPDVEDNPFAAKNLSGEVPPVKKAKPKPSTKAANKPADKKKTEQDGRLFESEDFFSQLAPEHDLDDIDLGTMPDLLEDNLESLEEPLEEAFTPDPQDLMDHQISASATHFGIEDEAPRSSFAKVAGLILLNAITLAALCGQFIYFQFDNLARNDAYRPLFKSFCATAGCTLPLKSDVSQIRGSNLVVRSHSMERNALVIDAIVYNRAKFAQPYPVIELRFDDVNGNTMASRRFTPQEYIHDNSIDLDNMPSDTPVHLTLEIVDPGQRAVNYQMNFYSTEQPSM